MKKQLQFKESQLYGWDTEPVDERPSEFMPSTGYATLSGLRTPIEATRRTKHRSRFGLGSVLVFALIVIAAGGWVLARLALMLHH